MPDPRIQLRDPWTAAVLAFLIPGAGHLYQRRFFKAVLYSVCIISTFTYGMAMGEWQTVYMHSPVQQPDQKPQLAWGYLAQVGVGLPALPAILQSRRYFSEANRQSDSLAGDVSNFTCDALFIDSRATSFKELTGTLNLDTNGTGTFQANDAEGQPVSLKLSGFSRRNGRIEVEPAIASSPLRMVECNTVDPEDGFMTGKLRCMIPRPFFDWFEVPPTEASLGNLHRKGKIFDLAQVLTWIAGLLNILVVWDAFEGPAYGYGDETSQKSDSDDSDSSNADTDSKAVPDEGIAVRGPAGLISDNSTT